jgi:hypothetical protein
MFENQAWMRLIVVALLLLPFCQTASARDDGRYAGSAVADADWDTKDGHYRVRLEGDWVDVPEDAVVAGPNRAGRTVVWLYYIDGHPQVRCSYREP